MKNAIRHGIDLKVAITLADRANTQPEASVAWFYVGETRASHWKELCERRLGPWAAMTRASFARDRNIRIGSPQTSNQV
jgi:hypothetical protein